MEYPSPNAKLATLLHMQFGARFYDKRKFFDDAVRQDFPRLSTATILPFPHKFIYEYITAVKYNQAHVGLIRTTASLMTNYRGNPPTHKRPSGSPGKTK